MDLKIATITFADVAANYVWHVWTRIKDVLKPLKFNWFKVAFAVFYFCYLNKIFFQLFVRRILFCPSASRQAQQWHGQFTASHAGVDNLQIKCQRLIEDFPDFFGGDRLPLTRPWVGTWNRFLAFNLEADKVNRLTDAWIRFGQVQRLRD